MKLFEHKQGNTFVVSEAMEWKDVPQEEKDKAYDMIEKHNSGITADNGMSRSYWIDVTGKYQVYYTLWLYKEVDPRVASYIKNPTYMGNVTTDLLSSVQKVLSKPGVQGIKVELVTDETRKNLIGKTSKETPHFKFGKYRGRAMADVFLDDPGYFSFLAKNVDPKYALTNDNLAIKHFAELNIKDATAKNLETSTSQFVGEVGGKFEGELEIYKIDVKPPTSFRDGYTIFKLKDANDNKFMTFNLGANFPDAKVGDKVKIRAKIKDHKLFVGIKFTILNYIKPA